MRAPPESAGSKHEWFYYPEMQSTEAIIFINFDSDETAPQFVYHGALDLNCRVDTAREWRGGVAEEGRDEVSREDAPAAPPVRLSLEVRVLVLIDQVTHADADVGGVAS